MRIRYSRWDGTQDPFSADLPAGEILEEMSDEILSGSGAESSLARLRRRGIPGRFAGTDELRRRLHDARLGEASRLNLEGPLEELRRRLDDIVERELRELSFRDGDDARLREQILASLPPDTAGRLGELSGYRFVDPEAQRDFDELMRSLHEDVLGAFFRGAVDGMSDFSPEGIRHLKDMLADLNRMVEARDRGEEVDFEAFKERYGDLLPGDPQTLDELLEQTARRLAAASRLSASLSPEQQRVLERLMQGVLGDLDLDFEMERLDAHLRELFPYLAWEERAFAAGEGAMPLSATVDALERLHGFESLDRAMAGEYPGASLADVDEEALRRTLGEAAVADVQRLKELERSLSQAGMVARREDGRLEVTPRGARELGERALSRVFEQLRRDREGVHEAREPGGLAEPTGSTRPWRFGDAGQIAVQNTVFNAVVRSEPGAAVRLEPDDFELIDAERRTEAATALLLDLSFSMPLRGHFVHAKKMALALHALIQARYPRDHLYLIGFSDYARQMEPQDLAAPGWERVYGTNMQHAFNLAGRLLADHPRASRQVIMVTDGEPTAHLEHSEAFFSWPPVPKTVDLTLREALRLSRAGVTLNVFMLEDSPGLVRFMERLARMTAGRVFLMDDEALGEFVVRDYVSRRSH